MGIGAEIKKRREAAGMKQSELAEAVGVGQSMIAQYERGTKQVTMPIAFAMAKVFDCLVDDLYGVE